MSSYTRPAWRPGLGQGRGRDVGDVLEVDERLADRAGGQRQLAGDTPGQQLVLDRLLDWLLVCTIRQWFDRPGGEPPAWYSAQRDPVVGAALRLLHDEPAAGWTVASLAERTAVSRATLAKRFTDLVGEPPLTYLTRWRMTLAADLLAGSDDTTIAEVARAVGYADVFGFSAAFTRTRGVRPSAYRRAPVTPPAVG